MAEQNTLDNLRDELFSTLRKLRDTTGDGIKAEVDRAKAVVEVSGAIIETAKVELQFLDQVGDANMPAIVQPARAAKFFTEGDPRFSAGRKGLATGKRLGSAAD
jgi:hypothetical protein